MQRSLKVVLMVRERREELEERALGEVLRQEAQARVVATRLAGELAGLRDGEARRCGVLLRGFEHQQLERDVRDLQKKVAAALEEVLRFEGLRIEQMAVYRIAHADREAISALQQQRHRAHMAALDLVERKAGEELFASRRALRQ